MSATPNSLKKLLAVRADLAPSGIAFTEIESGRTLTWERLFSVASNLSRDPRVAVLSGKAVGIFPMGGIEFPVTLMAYLFAGCRVVLLNPKFSKWELEQISAQMGGLHAHLLENEQVPFPYHWSCDREQLEEENSQLLLSGLILCTSGTTGKSKLIEFSESTLLAGAVVGREMWSGDHIEKILNLRPVFTSGGFNTWLPAFLSGKQHFLVREEHRAPHFTILSQLIERSDCDLVVLSAAYLRAVVLSLGAGETLQRARALKIYFGGERLPERILERIIGSISSDIEMRYGFTECATVLSKKKLSLTNGTNSSVGVPASPFHVEVSERGKLRFRGPGFGRLVSNGGKTSSLVGSDGFFSSDDSGEVDKGGEICLWGRDHGFLFVSGYRFHLSEVTKLCEGIPEISSCHAFDFADPVLGDAYYLSVESPVSDPLEQQRIVNSIMGGLIPQKRPRRVAFFSAFPLTASGKKNIRLIEAQFFGPMESHFNFLRTVRKYFRWRNQEARKSAVQWYDALLSNSCSAKFLEEVAAFLEQPARRKYDSLIRFWLSNALAYRLYKEGHSREAVIGRLKQAQAELRSGRVSFAGHARLGGTHLYWLLLIINEMRLNLRLGNREIGRAQFLGLETLLRTHALLENLFVLEPDAAQLKELARATAQELDFFQNILKKERGCFEIDFAN